MSKKEEEFHMEYEKPQSMSSIAFFGAPSLKPSSQTQLSAYIQEEEHTLSDQKMDMTLDKEGR